MIIGCPLCYNFMAPATGNILHFYAKFHLKYGGHRY